MNRLAALVISLGVSSLLLADHPRSMETPLNDGGIALSESFKSDLLIYKSIGGRTEVKGKEEERQWWCVWLCKRRVDKKAERITVFTPIFRKSNRECLQHWSEIQRHVPTHRHASRRSGGSALE